MEANALVAGGTGGIGEGLLGRSPKPAERLRAIAARGQWRKAKGTLRFDQPKLP